MKYITILIITFSPHFLLGQCISASATTVCGMEIIDFGVNNPIDGVTYAWDFGYNNLVDTSTSITHNFPASATDEIYTVTLTSSDSSCVETIDITVLSAPDASITDLNGGTDFFNCIETSGNLTYILTIENVSTTMATNTNYNIDWGDNSSVNTNNFTTLSHDYAPGYYDLTITVTGDSSLNCNTTTYVYPVFNGSSPDLGITNYSPNYYCSNQALIEVEIEITGFENNPDGTIYEVKINGDPWGSLYHPPPNIILIDFSGYPSSCGLYNDAYEIEVKAINPCGIQPGRTDIYISDPPQITASLTDTLQICVGEEYAVESSANIEIYNLGICEPDPNGWVTWEISPSTGWTLVSTSSPPTVIFNDPDFYTIVVEAANKCDTITSTGFIEVFPSPDSLNVVVDLSSNSGLNCVPTQGTFENSTSNPAIGTAGEMIFDWQVVGPAGCWSFLNNTDLTTPNLELDFSCAGNYTISLTGINICDTLTWDTTIVVYDVPTITLGIPDNFCTPPDVSNYVNYQTNGTDITDTLCFIYDINSVLIGTCDNTNSLTTGEYIVEVSAINDCGYSATVVDTFNILANAVDITIDTLDPLCPGTVIDLDTLVESTGGIWIVNNNPVPMPYTFEQTTDFTYELNDNGCLFSTTISIQVLDSDEADAGNDLQYCVGAVPPSPLVGTPSGGLWSGNGIQPDGTVTANTAGVYAFIYSDTLANCSSSDTMIYTLEEVIANMDILNQVCVGDTVTFNDTFTSIPASMQVSSDWTFGDSNSSTGNSPVHVYTQPGTYTPQLIVSGNFCADTVTQTITVVEQPVADFSISFAPCDTTIYIQNNSTGGELTYIWDFENGTSSDLESPPPINYSQGVSDTTYTVTLTVSNACGISIFSEDITIYPQLEAVIYTQEVVCNNTVLSLYGNLSTGYIDNYQWFIDGNPIASSPSADITYNLPPVDTTTNFQITLIVSNDCGTHTTTQTITVIPPVVKADFTYFPSDTIICQYDTVQFVNLSTGYNFIYWDFGNGTFVAAGETPIHIFDQPGQQVVKLWAIGCTDEDIAIQTFDVEPAPQACIAIPASACVGTSICFSQCDTTNQYIPKWVIDGQVYPDYEPCVTFSNPGTYQVTLTVTNPDGCSSTYAQDSIKILPIPIADFSWDKDNCNLSVTVQEQSQGATSYIWDWGDGQFSVDPAATHTYAAEGSYTITMTAKNQDDCLATASRQIQFEPVPVSEFEYELQPSCDVPAQVDFINTSENVISYEWKAGNGQSLFLEHPSFFYEERNTYEVTLIVYDQYGCSDTSSTFIIPHFCNGIGVPNAFIPGGPPEVSLFKPVGEGLKEYNLQIFSTYGELLWQTTALQNGQPAEGWDGTHQGKLLGQDVYVWKIHGVFEDGTIWQGMTYDGEKPRKIGSVTLLR